MSHEPVYLHVGLPKTGTTYLQEFLWTNRRELVRAGLLYPGDAPGRQFKAVLDLRATGFAGNEVEGVEGSWAAVTAQALDWRGRSVISHELMAALTARQAQRAVASLQPRPVHVLVSLRDFSRIVPATWQEVAKNRFVESWSDFLDRVRPRDGERDRDFWALQDASRVLRLWADLLPPEHVHVITVPRPDAPRALLLQRFAEVLGFEPTDFKQDVQVPNDSIGIVEVALLQRINEASRERLPWPAYHGVVKHHTVPRLLGGREESTRVTLPESELGWVRAEAQRTVDTIRELGVHVVGELDDLTPRPSPSTYVDPASVTAAQQLDVAVDTKVGLAAVVHERDTELRRLRRELGRAHAEVDRLRHAERQLQETVAHLRDQVETSWLEHQKRKVVRLGRRNRAVGALLDLYRRMRRRR